MAALSAVSFVSTNFQGIFQKVKHCKSALEEVNLFYMASETPD